MCKQALENIQCPNDKIKNLAETLFFDTSFLFTIFNESVTSTNDIAHTSSPSVKQKSEVWPEDQYPELRGLCREFVFKIKHIMDMPLGYNVILAHINSIHNVFLKHSDPKIQNLGMQFAGENFLSGTLRDLINQFYILLKPFKDLLEELKFWQNKLVKTNPAYEVLGTPMQFLTTQTIRNLNNNFKIKASANSGFSTRGKNRGRGRGRGHRGRHRGGHRSGHDKPREQSSSASTDPNPPKMKKET